MLYSSVTYQATTLSADKLLCCSAVAFRPVMPLIAIQAAGCQPLWALQLATGHDTYGACSTQTCHVSCSRPHRGGRTHAVGNIKEGSTAQHTKSSIENSTCLTLYYLFILFIFCSNNNKCDDAASKVLQAQRMCRRGGTKGETSK